VILPALSILQPWTALIILRSQIPELKDVENRTWPVPVGYLNRPVLLHAGKSRKEAVLHWDLTKLAGACLSLLTKGNPQRLEKYRDCLSFGGIVGVATITGCVRDSASPWAAAGQWHWLLADAKPLPFFACKGSLGFFKVDYPHSLEAAHAQD